MIGILLPHCMCNVCVYIATAQHLTINGSYFTLCIKRVLKSLSNGIGHPTLFFRMHPKTLYRHHKNHYENKRTNYERELFHLYLKATREFQIKIHVNYNFQLIS